MGKFLKQLKNERGLTLVELLAVVVILGIIGTIAFVAIGNVIGNSKKDAHVANAQQLISAAKLQDASNIRSDGEVSFTTGDVSGKQVKLETVDSLINPWNAEDTTYVGQVTKNAEGNYTVTINGDTSIKCALQNVPESEINKGKDSACGWKEADGL